MAKMPLSFEPNRGQTDPRVQFLSRGPGYNVFFTKDETVMTLKDTKTSNAVVRMRFVGGTNSASAHPLEALANTSNYLIGNDQSKWITDVKEYAKLRYENVYPGIDVVYQGDQQQLRYDFIVKPGASVTSIQLAFEGADKIAVTKDGDLALTIGGKTLVTRKPFTYQEDAGVKKEVASHYVVKDGRVTFELAKYDTSKDVVVDPTVLFITYLGGLLNDSVNGVAIVNPSQSISSQPSFYYVTGTTASPNFPGVSGEYQPAQAGANDVFVSKISFNGAILTWSTYLGGNSQDSGNAIAVDIVSPAGVALSPGGTAGCTASGCAVVVGQTYSSNFPTAPYVTTNPLNGTDDAFVSKLSSDGKTLIMSSYIGGPTNDQATGVAVNNGTVAPNGTFSCTGAEPQAAGCGDIYVGGYTDSAFFLCPANNPSAAFCTNANHNNPSTSSSDAFVIRIPVTAYSAAFINATGGLTAASGVLSTLYGGFGEEFAHGLAFNPTSKMVYIAGDTTTASQNFVTPNAINLPGITNQTAITGLPGNGTQARGGFVAAFDSTTLTKTFASYVAVAPAGGTGTESIAGVAAEGGSPALGCATPGIGGTCTNGNGATGAIAPAYGSFGHIYITGSTTSNVDSKNIAVVVPSNACVNGLNATDGTVTLSKTGVTSPSGCTTALVTQTPFNLNHAVTSGCSYPVNIGPFGGNPATATCNLAAFVAILDSALLTTPGSLPAPIGNQIEYWAYYSAVAINAGTAPLPFTYNPGNSSAISNAIAIDTNPTTNNTVYSLGTYQQMYITGSTTVTVSSGQNNLPTTSILNGTPAQEVFTSYNVGTTGGGGVGGLTPAGESASATIPNPTAAFIARFNPNGLAAQAYGGAPNFGIGNNPLTNTTDRSPLLNTPQFNYGEFLYSSNITSTSGTSGSASPNTSGNAIAVDPTRAVLIGGATNNTQTGATSLCTVVTFGSCPFTTTNTLPAGGLNAGGTDGWVSVLFFNDILTDAPSVTSANPFLEPGAPEDTCQPGSTPATCPQGQQTYLETTPPPFGPTFDFAISDMVTQTQTFQVIFTGQTSGQVLQQTPFFIPKDSRSGYGTTATANNGLPGSGVVYYLPCLLFGAPGNPYPAPGGPYGPTGFTNPNSAPACTIPGLYGTPAGSPTGIIPTSFSGWPSADPSFGKTAVSPTPIPGQGWLIVSQDVNPGVVRLTLDRRAAAGLLEGTWVAQFLVTTYDSQNPAQWPPCGPQSVLNPFVSGATCTNPTTPLPADNESILVTVRLVMRPSLFLSRNAGFLTGITSQLTLNPLFGPAASLTQEDGTSKVPDWYNNDGTAAANLTGTFGINSGPAVCTPGYVLGQNWGWVLNANPQDGHGVLGSTFGTPPTSGVLVPCPISLPYAPNPVTGLGTIGSGQSNGATAYAGNGPGDDSVAPPVYVPTPITFLSVPTGTTPNISFLYDAGTVQVPNISAQQGLVTTRPDTVLPGFNADSQGGADPVTQRNDATVHDYYVDAVGPATLSVEAINCTNWTNAAVGNWLAVAVGGSATYTPICTAHTAATVGTSRAPVVACYNVLQPACAGTPGAYSGGNGVGIVDDVNNGEQIALDFLAKAFSNRTGANGIPTGLYSANVYVWSTRAKNSVPGYCLGASIPPSGTNGTDPNPLCGGTGNTTSSASATGPATDNNPNPQIIVTQQQMFTVSLMVFDTTQIIQITPNSCPAGGFTNSTPTTEYVTVGNSENLDTGNPLTGFGVGYVPPAPLAQAYPQFGPNGDALVVFSLLPFQTTGQAIAAPCPANNSASCIPPFTGQNYPVALPSGVTLIPQTLAQYNACALPTGTYSGNTITGASVPGVGSLQQTGPLSQTVFVPSFTGSNQAVTIYACRPTVAPAWLNSVLYPGDNLGAFPGAPEEYSNGNGGTLDPVPSTAFQTCGATGGTSVVAMPGSKVGLVRQNVFDFDSNGNEVGPAPVDPADRVDAFVPPGGVLAGDQPVVGDWTGDGHAKAGWFRPSTGQWWLDAANTGVYSVGGSYTYQFGGPNDIAIVGDWAGLGKAAIGVVRSGFLWILDLNADGIFEAPAGTPTVGDAVFAFGNVGDMPVTGNWFGKTSAAGFPQFQAGGVRTYCNPTCTGGPFLWLLDSGIAGTVTGGVGNPGTLAGGVTGTHAVGNLPGIAFGGATGDIPVTGDWYNTGTWQFGDFRSGFLWVLDGGAPLAPQASHFVGFSFAYGGIAGDKPIVGKW
jgi:hypothetical protein